MSHTPDAPRSQQPDGYAVVRDGVSFVGIWANVEAASQVSGRYPNSEVRPMVYAVSEKGAIPSHYQVERDDAWAEIAKLKRENADLQMRLARKAEQAADLESQCANLRRDLEQADSVCDAALRSLPSATGAMPKAFYEIVEVANTEGMPDSTPLPIWPKDVAWDFTPLTVGDIRAMLAAAPAPALADPVAWTTVLKMIERGMAVYKERHPKWWKRMDGTPILNDLPVVIATEICETTLYAAPSSPVEAGATRKWVAAYWRLTKNLNLGEVSDYDDELANDIRELRDEAEQILDGPYMKREQDAGECLSCVDGQCVSAEHCVTLGLDSPEPQREQP